jgi:hypothetical protein
MEDFSKATIWKYMDLAKFASLLTTQSLYFARPTEFNDPYEGLLPKSHNEAISNMLQKHLDDVMALKKPFAARGIPANVIDDSWDALVARFSEAQKEVTAKVGVSCWHESEYESEAMWKLYSASGQGIAIESTIEQLTASLGTRKPIIDRVRYMDFEDGPIEKGHQHNLLFIKRKSFEHEKEVRATLLLPEAGKGIPILCDLDVLVTCVHVSPLVASYVKDAVEALCLSHTPRLNKPIRHSTLYCAPKDGLKFKRK